MAQILLVWELGAHLGHLTRLAGLAQALHQRGHSITFALRELHSVDTILGKETPYRILQAPVFLPTLTTSRQPLTYSEILQCNGYFSSQSLRYLVKAWQALSDLIKPDLIVYDYSPTAMLAYRKLAVPKIELGSSFFMPPKASPMPAFHNKNSISLQQRQEIDNHVIKSINHILVDEKLPPLKHVYELFDDTLQLINSYPELDCYQNREQGQYIGLLSATASGATVNWSIEKKSTRIFAYIKPSYAKIKELMGALVKTGAEVRAYIPNCPKEISDKLASDNIQISSRPYDMEEALNGCDICICHGGHDTVVQSLLAGVPLLLIPQYIEQLETATAVAKLKAGLIAAPNEEQNNLQEKLQTLSSDKNYLFSAGQFAERYSHMTSKVCVEAVAEQCELLLQ